MLDHRIRRQLAAIVERFGSHKQPMATIESVVPQQPLSELSTDYVDAVTYSMGSLDPFHRTVYPPSGTFQVGDQAARSRWATRYRSTGSSTGHTPTDSRPQSHRDGLRPPV